MERRFEGTFQTQKEVQSEVERLINEEGYAADELLIVTVKENSEMFKSSTLESVEVDFVTTEENGSFWEKIKETLSFGTYDSNEAHNTLEEHGVPHEIAEHHIEALEDGEIVLLSNSDAPKHANLSEVNKNVTHEENEDKMTNKKDNSLDEVNSEEEKAITGEEFDVKPTDVDTKETDPENLDGAMDPSQAQDAREEDQVDTNETDESNQEQSPKKDDGESLETTPDLTGEEETVESEDANHGYPKNIAKGVVKPEASSPLNAEEKSEKDPSEKSEAPESDAKYTTDTNEAGMKEEPSEENK